MSKYDYVKRQGQTRSHSCHWPGCGREVPPSMWGCGPHWFKLPKRLRDRIWATYEIGQEVSMTPSDAYLDAALAVQAWIEESGLYDGSQPDCDKEATQLDAKPFQPFVEYTPAPTNGGVLDA